MEEKEIRQQTSDEAASAEPGPAEDESSETETTVRESDESELAESKKGEEEPEKKEPGEPEEEAVESETAVAAEAAGELGVFVDTTAFHNEKKRKHLVRNILIAVFSGLAVVYVVMAGIFYFCFFPGTVVNGQDISFKSLKQADELLDKQYADYQLQVTFRNGEAVIGKNDIQLSACCEHALKEIKSSQNPFLWFTFFMNTSYTVTYDVTYNTDMLDAFCSKLSYLNSGKMKKPEEPVIAVQDGKAVCVTGDPGTSVNQEQFYALLDEYLIDLREELILEEEECYLLPEYNPESEEIINALEKCNRYLSSSITYEYGATDIPISPEDIFGMIRVDQSYHCTLDKDMIRKYLEQFSEEYDTLGTDRMFKTHKGDSVIVTGKRYGWQMDVEAETENLYSDILNGRTVKREPAFTQTGYVYRNGNDIGSSYAEVDLTNQHMYLYLDGVMVFESDFVSGCINEGHRTPGGLYFLKYKARNAVLRGADYETPVSYWMPFNRGIGFHDANWRSSFGGNIYVSNGSHGCINLPVGKARELYNLIREGMPVVCYWR